MNCSVHTTQPKPSNEATNHSRPRRGTGAESRSSTATRTFNDADLWAPQNGFWFWFGFLVWFLQSQMQTTTSVREGKKQKTNKRRDEGSQVNKTMQDNTKQTAKAKHRLALNVSVAHKQQ